MQINPEISIPICIEQGSIYLYQLDTVNKDGTPYSGNRFFIVLNLNPQTDEILILSTITTKIDKQKEFIKKIGEDPSTLVSITVSDFPNLSQDSAVNCNRIYETTLKELVEKVKNGGKIFNHNLPKTVMSALISGVLKSKQVSPEVKQRLI